MRNFTKYLSMLMVVLSILIFASQTRATVIYTQNWGTGSGTTPPAGWAINQLGYGSYTSFGASGSYPSASPYPGCSEMVIFDSWDAPAGYQNQLYQTTAISTVGYSNITVDFTEYYQSTFTGGDGVTIQWSTNGTTWTSAGSNWGNYSATSGWVVNTQALPVGAAGQATLYIGLLFTSQWGYDVYFDVMHVNGLQTGTLTGTVKNCNTLALLSGVNVWVGTTGNWTGPAVTNGSGVYTLSGIPTGLQTVSAVFTGYTTYTAPVTIVANSTVTYNFCMFPLPGILTGIVTNCANGNPVVGAYVTWGTYSTYSVAGGLYSISVYSSGPNTLQASKDGFMLFSQNGVTVTNPSPPVTTVNLCLNEDTPPPSSPFVAALNTGQTSVNLNWGLPVDNYDLIYDDGIQDNFGIWLTGNDKNKNAVRFTPLSYPTIIKGFYVNIGTALNYPSGSNPFSPVDFAIYNEVSGLPGTLQGTLTTITPAAYGWTKANFVTPITLTSGNFYIVMLQTGASTATPGIAIDTTSYQMRSYSQMGDTGPWLPGPGNYMIRAIVNGSGGPLMMSNQQGRTITASPIPGLIYEFTPSTVTGVEGSPKVYPEMGYNPDNLLGYQVWRLLQGQEATPAVWTSVGTPTGLNTVDNSWPSLPCDPYRWAVEAQYTFNRWSSATFSNALGKCWTCNVTVNITLSCDSVTAAGATVTFTNQGPDTVYTWVMDATGTHTFTNFWKGIYNLTVNKYDYQVYTQTAISIMGDMTFNVTLLQFKEPPTGLVVHDSDALATWYPPIMITTLLSENFNGGFATNGWVADAGSNWAISTYDGNPGNCAEFYYAPAVQNYSQSLTSKLLVGDNSPFLKLQYDVYLNNYSTYTLEQLAVEVWNGTTWHSVANYDNSSGSIPWTTVTLDIASVAPSSGFKVRFRAYGENSYNINYWDVDNVKIFAETGPHDPCIIGYNFYLNGVTDGFTKDTFYHIPPSHLVYGQSYLACVAAIYGSGYSAQDCVSFTDHFLCAPDTMGAIDLDCSALVTWKKPNCGGCTLTTYIFDDGTANDGYTCTGYLMGNYFPIAANASGVVKSVDMYFSSIAGNTTAQNLTLSIYNSSHTTVLGSTTFLNSALAWPSGQWDHVVMADIPYTGPFFAMVTYGTSSYANYFDLDNTSSSSTFPVGFGYVDMGGTWSPVATAFGYDPKATFLQRVNVCVNSKDKDAPITTIDPTQLPPSTTVLPNLATNTKAASTLIGSSNVEVEPPAGTITPDAPEVTTTLIGYDVYRNGLQIAYLPYPDTLQYYDYNLAPGIYHYTVDAKYNLGTWIPSTGTSRKATPPATVQIACGYPLPFYEPWDNASFTFQQWSFTPNQSNWSINTALGDPLPCADFSWQPVITNYNSSLVTPNINASAWTCADIYCDFDLKLIDLHATGTEKMDVDVLVGGAWLNKAEFSDSGSFDWSLKHINISSVMGKAFQLRFRANGANSGNIMHWYVDNIHIYGVCRPPRTLAGHENQFVTTLTWHSPKCPVQCSLKTYTYDDGTAGDGYTNNTAGTYQIGNYFPISGGTSGVIKSFDMYYSSNGNSSAQSCVIYIYNSTHSAIIGQSASFTNTGAAWPSGSWVNVTCPNIQYSGPFYAMVDYSGYTGLPMKNFLDLDNSTTWAGFPVGVGYCNNNGSWTPAATAYGVDPVCDFIQRANVCENGAKDKNAPITTIDPMQYAINHNVRPNTAATLGTITGYTNIAVGAPHPVTTPEAPEGSQLLGYNVWRTPDGNLSGNFFMVNTSIVTDSTYQETHPSTTQGPLQWKYYVTAEFQDSLYPGVPLCEPSSDTILINFPAVGINELTNTISLYPNPANDLVNVVSSNDIKTIEVLNYIGQTVYKNNDVNLKVTKLDVASFTAGVYFVKITTTAGIKATKITVTH